jgi:hypothetical protein
MPSLRVHMSLWQRSYGQLLRAWLPPSSHLINLSLLLYFSLLLIIHQLAYDHPAMWAQEGPAKSMLDFHSEHLLQIWSNAFSFGMWILRAFTSNL